VDTLCEGENVYLLTSHTHSPLNHNEKCSAQKLDIKMNLTFRGQQSYRFRGNERKWF
jgi:hypothetical protein